MRGGSPQRCSDVKEYTADAARKLSQKYKNRRAEKRKRGTREDPDQVFETFMRETFRKIMDRSIKKGLFVASVTIPSEHETIIIEQLQNRGFGVDCRNSFAYVSWYPKEEDYPELI